MSVLVHLCQYSHGQIKSNKATSKELTGRAPPFCRLPRCSERPKTLSQPIFGFAIKIRSWLQWYFFLSPQKEAKGSLHPLEGRTKSLKQRALSPFFFFTHQCPLRTEPTSPGHAALLSPPTKEQTKLTFTVRRCPEPSQQLKVISISSPEGENRHDLLVHNST